VTSTAWTLLTGVAAALCTALAFVPQLFSMRKPGSAELSSAMLAIYLAGLGLWLVYGLMIGAAPVIAANAVSIVIVSAVTFRKRAAVRVSGGGQQRLRIAIDMDEVMADALAEHVRRYNATFGATLAIADLRGHDLEDWIAPAEREAVEAMLDASFFTDLAVMPDCQEVVRELAARYDVLVVTAAMDVPCSFDAKFRWLQRHFPFIPTSHIVFCGDKGIIDADYLIDDRARHFERFKGHPLLFSAPHNAAESRYPRVDSWKDVREVFARLERRKGPAWQSPDGRRRLGITTCKYNSCSVSSH
jgi:5'-nucleotidase